MFFLNIFYIIYNKYISILIKLYIYFNLTTKNIILKKLMLNNNIKKNFQLWKLPKLSFDYSFFLFLVS
jgi:hypothetical protein